MIKNNKLKLDAEARGFAKVNLPVRYTLKHAVLILFALTQLALPTVQAQVTQPGGSCKVEAHPSWSAVEKWAWDRLCMAEVADFNERYGGCEPDPATAANWDDTRLLSQNFLESVLLHQPWASAIGRRGVRINGALFDTEIELVDGRIEHPFRLSRSRILGRANLRRITTRGDVSFAYSYFQRELKLSSSKIDGHLYLRGARVAGQLSINSMSVASSLVLGDGDPLTNVCELAAKNGVQSDMIKAKVPGALNLDSDSTGAISFPGKLAEFSNIDMGNTVVGGSLNLIGSTVSGTFTLDSATIGRSVYLKEATFKQPIEAGFIQVGGNFDLQNASLSGLDLTGAKIKGEFTVATPGKEPTWRDDSRLILHNTSVDAIQDTPTPGVWPQNMEMHGFVYRMLGGLESDDSIKERGSQWFVDWLARCEPYTQQPYEQLAYTLDRIGQVEASGDVMYAGRERARALAREEGQTVTWIGQTALKYTIGYGLGNRYFRSFYWVLALVLTGTLLLRLSAQHRVVDQEDKPPLRLAFFYSLDMLLPIIHLRDRHYAIDLNGAVRYYFYFHQIMGYVLASFLLAGLSGISN